MFTPSLRTPQGFGSVSSILSEVERDWQEFYFSFYTTDCIFHCSPSVTQADATRTAVNTPTVCDFNHRFPSSVALAHLPTPSLRSKALMLRSLSSTLYSRFKITLCHSVTSTASTIFMLHHERHRSAHAGHSTSRSCRLPSPCTHAVASAYLPRAMIDTFHCITSRCVARSSPDSSMRAPTRPRPHL